MVLLVERFRFALVSVEIRRVSSSLLGHHKVVVGPAVHTTLLPLESEPLHRVQVAPQLGYLRISWTKLLLSVPAAALEVAFLQAKVLNQY